MTIVTEGGVSPRSEDEPSRFIHFSLEELAGHTRRLREATESGDLRRMFGAMEAVLAARCLAATHPRAMRTTSEIDAVSKFSAAFVVALKALTPLRGDVLGERRHRDLLESSRDQAGRSALMLSGGGSLGNHHLGVLRTLVRRGLLPSVISGASAGSLFAAVAGTRRDDELASLLDDYRGLFASRNGPEPLDSGRLRHLIDRVVPDVTFAEAFAMSDRAINIVVSARATPNSGLILSNKTTPNILVRAAVQASCSVPFMFEAVELELRAPGSQAEQFRPEERWMDGSIFADLPAAALRSIHCVDRTIASMVNPLVLPFATHPREDGAMHHWLASMGTDFLRGAVGSGLQWIKPVVSSWPSATLALETWRGVLAQNYRADIMILPRERFYDPRTLTDLVDENTLHSYVQEGERSAIAQIKIIEAAIGIEQALNRV